MTWGLFFRARQELKGSLWVVPLAGAVLGVVLSQASLVLESRVNMPSELSYTSGTALAVLTTIVGATVGLTGFVVTVSVLVVQMATGTFSARYMRLWYRDGVLKAVLAVLVGTFTFSFTLLREIGSAEVPNLGVTLAGFLLGLGLVLFLVFLDRFVHRLRPVKVAAIVAGAGRRSLRAMAHAAPAAGSGPSSAEVDALRTGEPSLVVRSTGSGAVQAIHVEGLVRWAAAEDCVLVFRHGVGAFVSTGTRTLEVYGSVRRPPLAERRLRGMIALGIERTIEQDPAFAVRIMVDVAIRALSPAVNDPTTAVQVLNHLEDTLSLIGTTPGLGGRWEFRDAEGRVRLIVPTHRWADFLELAVTEIREYGARAIQVVRRLRAMLEELRETVLPEYVAAVEQELARLDATVAGTWSDAVDLDRARYPDRQGLGGAAGVAS